MQNTAVFLEAMQQHPEDNSLRLVFADWLEERGDQRGELIRLLHTLTQEVEVPQRRVLEEQLRTLVASGVKPVGPFWTNSIGMRFAWIPAGTFLMGSPVDEREEGEDQHKVTLTRGFFLAIHPVTQASWQEVMGSTSWQEIMGRWSSRFHGHDHSVGGVSWYDCQEFLQTLRDRDSHAYRLPTEAEWEYACRAGTTTPFSFGETISTKQANIAGHDPSTPVGSFLSNGWGLHDMHGNVFEWCADWYEKYPQQEMVDPRGPETGERRVLRGGASVTLASGVRSAYRISDEPSRRNLYHGFRAAMTSALG